LHFAKATHSPDRITENTEERNGGAVRAAPDGWPVRLAVDRPGASTGGGHRARESR